MNSINNLDLVQSTVVALALKNGVPIDELQNKINAQSEMYEWSIDYRSSLAADINHQLGRMLNAFNVVKQANEVNDLEACKAGLVSAAIAAHTLMNMFEDVKDDCWKIVNGDSRFVWPNLSDDYKMPKHYGFSA